MTSMPRALRRGDLGHARRPAVDRDDERRARRRRGVDRGQRQAVALVEPARDVGLDRDAEAAQGEGHDREPGQAVGVEVAEDEDPLAAVAGARASGPGARSGVGQRGRVVEAVERIARTRRRVLAGRSRRGRRGGRPAGAEMPCAGAASTAGGRRRRASRKVQRKRGSTTTSGCHGALHRGSTGRLRRRPQDAVRRTRGARVARQAAVPAVVPQLPVDEQRARRRRSTSRSPR